MTSKLTRDEINEVVSTYGKSHIAHRMAVELLAAMDSEPVIVVGDDGGDGLAYRRLIQSFAPGTKLYRHAQPAPERDQVRIAHAEWSQATFGNVGPVGPLKHLSKEALEAVAEPGDLSEWADMQFLLWDAQRRAGITDEQITQAMIEKLAVNKLREWPEPKDGEPRLHIKEQPAPAFPDFDNVLESLDYEVRCNAWESEHVLKACQATYDACRAAMLQELQKSAGAEATCRSNKNVQALHTKSPAQSDCCPAQNHASPEQNGDTPAQSQGWIPVSEQMPEHEVDVQVYCPDKKEQMVAYLERNELEGYFRFATWRTGEGIYCQPTHWMPLPAAPQEVK
ncbi:DUF550 domain-containing protein [Klebsiella pneumoniae]|nr:DUF550 domain-containing protein [Klebsiella pneumoniae]